MEHNLANNQDEFEEVEVFVKFPDFESLNLLKDSDTIELIGLETESPICRIRDITFAGEHCSALGSQLFFEKQDNPNAIPAVDLICATTDAIEFHFENIQDS